VVKILVVSYSFLSLLAVYLCLLFYDLSSIIGYIGLVGIFWRAGSRAYWPVCVFAVWGAGPLRVYLVVLLVWVSGRYGFLVLLALFWRVFV